MTLVSFFLEIVAIMQLQVTRCVARKLNAVCPHSLYVQLPLSHGPMSVTALIGTNAQFHCAGTGNYLVWVVDGLQDDHVNILARGITAATNTSSDTVQSTLTVPATSENNYGTKRYDVPLVYLMPV